MPLDHLAPTAPSSADTVLPHVLDSLVAEAERLMNALMETNESIAAVDPNRPVALSRRGEILRLSARLSRLAGWLICARDAQAGRAAMPEILLLETATPGALDQHVEAPELRELRARLDHLAERTMRVAKGPATA